MLGGFSLGLLEFVACAFRVLDGLGFCGNGFCDDLRHTRRADEAELLQLDTDRIELLLDEALWVRARNSDLLSP